MELGRLEVSWNTNFTMIPNELWDIEDLSHEGFRVFSYLIRLGANKDGEAFPSYPTIASKCQILNSKGEICKTKTRRIIEELITKGLVKKYNRKKKGTNKFGSNLYVLTHPKELLNPIKTRDKEEYDIIIDTPCVTTEEDSIKKPNKIKDKKSDTPVSSIKTGYTGPKLKKSDTYIDLLNNTSLKRKDDDRSIKDISEDKKSQSELLENCYDLISKATGLDHQRVKMCIAPSLLWKVDLQELIKAFSRSKYLKGIADKKVPISTFGSLLQLNKVLGGFYEDRPETIKELSGTPPKEPCVIRNQGQDHSEVINDIKDKMTDFEILKGEVSREIIKLGKIKLMAKLTLLSTSKQLEDFRNTYLL